MGLLILGDSFVVSLTQLRKCLRTHPDRRLDRNGGDPLAFRLSLSFLAHSAFRQCLLVTVPICCLLCRLGGPLTVVGLLTLCRLVPAGSDFLLGHVVLPHARGSMQLQGGDGRNDRDRQHRYSHRPPLALTCLEWAGIVVIVPSFLPRVLNRSDRRQIGLALCLARCHGLRLPAENTLNQARVIERNSFRDAFTSLLHFYQKCDQIFVAQLVDSCHIEGGLVHQPVQPILSPKPEDSADMRIARDGIENAGLRS